MKTVQTILTAGAFLAAVQGAGQEAQAQDKKPVARDFELHDCILKTMDDLQKQEKNKRVFSKDEPVGRMIFPDQPLSGQNRYTLMLYGKKDHPFLLSFNVTAGATSKGAGLNINSAEMQSADGPVLGERYYNFDKYTLEKAGQTIVFGVQNGGMLPPETHSNVSRAMKSLRGCQPQLIG